ncbi:MAG: type II secretion system F family protein, partial [Bacillota bacterium]|nr:type II secretion system F family protein [Bacillota bacterium]
LPPAQCRLLELGMQSGSDDVVMNLISQRLDTEAETALQDAVGRVEPALVLVTSVLLGLILLSVMLPLMHILSTIG